MKRYYCTSTLTVCCCSEDCDYIYDPLEGDKESGIAPGTDFKDLPGDWVCPNCGAGKEAFREEN